MEYIASIRNPAVKRLRELKKRVTREALGLAFIEGQRLVTEALKAREAAGEGGGGVEALYLSEGFARSDGCRGIRETAAAAGLSPVVMSDYVFEAVSDTKEPQGVLALVRFMRYDLMDLFAREASKSRIVILDRVSDPGNAGAVVRTAAAAGFTGVIFSQGSVDIYSPKTLRATMGAVFRIPFLREAALPAMLDRLRRRGFALYASAPEPFGASPDRPRGCFDCEISAGDVALVVGGEAFGVGAEVIERCDSVLSIPMPGGVESLNAGVAAGILIYEILRRGL